ncbi:DeoR/GlpR family DNA-binding transcription regulator [Pelagicoccus mobilis]|uniref:DeoR/GlpR transcriptional regulator n=1 Tax=Pelagicoccus mobilis TaxID=415221 RepID=A0A934RSD7_9BACT|nr:DeoR/GlpR family DNA-binding transcription regulator [Pelagicoccus mobilis]MBK1875486.1 DeoR/GlpR transcriptional regulator [Pelagicoccus mobilis]
MTREEQILELLSEQEKVSVEDLTRSLNSSPATIRRALNALEEKGKLIRVHGGAIPAPQDAGELNFLAKQNTQSNPKRRIASYAAQVPNEGETLFIDSGSTTYEFATQILKKGHYQIYTNSLPIFELACKLDYPINIVGGRLRPLSRAIVGAAASEWLAGLWFDRAILGASGLHPKAGFFTTEEEEAAVKKTACMNSEQTIVLADSSKWDTPAAVQFASWKAVDLLISDTSLSDSAKKTIKTHKGTRIETA